MSITQPARQPSNRPDMFDVRNAMQACYDDFGGIIKLQLAIKSVEPSTPELFVEAAWYRDWDSEMDSPFVTVQEVYQQSRDGDLPAATLAAVSRLYDLLTTTVQADRPIITVNNGVALVNRYWLA